MDHRKHSDMCSALAFYGQAHSAEAIRSFFDAIVTWMSTSAIAPDRLAISGQGFSGNYISFRGAQSQLQRKGFGNVESLDISSMIPGGDIPMSDYRAFAAYSKKHSIANLVVREPLARLTKESLLPLAMQIISAIRPAYGIGFRRRHRKGPEGYAIGVPISSFECGVPTDEEDEEDMAIMQWGLVGTKKQVYRHGQLRDVYEWNFLTAPQLRHRVGRLTLKGWIEEDAARGTLSPFEGNMSLWTVAESRIPAIRAELHAAGAIFDWRKYADDESADESEVE